MSNAPSTGKRLDEFGDSFTVYADFNCPFCYALNERIHLMKLDRQVDFRLIQHAPDVSSDDSGFEVLSELTREVAEVRRRAPSTRINIPMFRPNSGPASLLVFAVAKTDPLAATRLRQRVYRALWIDGEDISSAQVLSALLRELDIDPPDGDAMDAAELETWQQTWDRSAEFERNIPIMVSARGETVIGFPLEPELDTFLETGTLLTDKSSHGACVGPERQRILVLDNDVVSLQMIIRQMRETQVEVVDDFGALVATVLNLGMPDLVLVNTALLGGIEGTDWWRNSTDSDLETAVPVIFVSEDRSTEAEVAAFEAGATDFIAKPFHPRVLQARLKMHLQARRSQQALNNIARVDALTSVCNRREFDLRLLSEWGRGARSRHSLALLMIDVDKFKEYNDHHGHLRGDDCLVAVAGILDDCMQRSGDQIARYGGEEFVALLPEADIEGALKVAQDCRDAVLAAQIPHVTSSVSRFVTISVGVAAMMPIYEQSSTVLIEQADIALYQAKQDGRNRVCSFDDVDDSL